MFNDIENTLLDNDLQACLIGDFNAHTGNVSEYVVIDNNILDVLNLQDDDKLPLSWLANTTISTNSTIYKEEL
jgi:hypothetical protein